MEDTNQIQNAKVQIESSTKKSFSFFNTKWKINIVNDHDAPLLFSRLTIYIFSCLFSVIFGGILMAINLKRIGKKDKIWVVLLYSFAYTLLMYLVLSQFQRNTMLTIIGSMIGSFALYNYFWEKYIGSDTKYRPNRIWIPLIIAIVIFSLLIFVTIASNT
jgi:hypothetical protein